MTESKRDKKKKIIKRVYEDFTKYKQCLLVKLDHVSSNQVQQARLALRKEKKGVMVVGKNTVIKKAISLRQKAPETSDEDYDWRKSHYTEVNSIDKIAALLKGKVALIFSDTPVYELKPLIESNRKPAAAKVGMVAPIDVTIPPGPTGLDPSQISFFHALNMSTKIQKGQIEISKEFRVCTAGKKVANSEAVLCQKLNIKPFAYGMEILYVFDEGTVLTPEIFNMDPHTITEKFRKVANNMAALSLALGQPNALSVPHMIVNSFKNIASIALESGLTFKQLSGLSSGGASTGGKAEAAPKKDAKKEDAKAEVKEEVVPEQAVDMGGMFDEF
jgi:large subunit ribosomal protein LP0